MEISQKSVDELAERIAEVTILDVRELDEFTSGHVPGAHHVPLSDFDAAFARLGLAGDEELFVICRSGARSQRAAEALGGIGVIAHNVAGGTMAWIAAGYETSAGLERG